MRFPWLAIAIGLLVYLISGSAIAAVSVFIGSQLLILAFLAVITAALKSATDKAQKFVVKR